MAGIYIHIPFCRHKCHYCNFFSSASQRKVNDYIQSVLKEISFRQSYLKQEKINTVYFGGGTPSLLEISAIGKILEQIHSHFQFSSNPEITLEANPEDITPGKAIALRNVGINRLSIGIQSFNDVDLVYLGRHHTSKQAYDAILIALDAGFNNLNIDFIYGIPTLTSSDFDNNLNKAFALHIPHISAYALTVEPRTSLQYFIATRKRAPLNEEQTSQQFRMLMHRMRENGYQHYEISNFCVEGMYAKHNTAYWTGEKYLGVGPSAHSFDGESRQWNISSISTYIAALQNDTLPFSKEILTPADQYNEYIMTSLRTMWGCDTALMEKKFGEKITSDFYNSALKLSKKKWLSVIGNRVILTDEGKLFADHITSDLFSC
ncbi:MAG: radical SAM family heme chaperone HemW [Lentimicrobiaceae bacterium]|nr:radical SAM family heme chaperone HemW [Lentimicrobiaceae bacterium]